jgi:hypothetical protein
MVQNEYVKMRWYYLLNITVGASPSSARAKRKQLVAIFLILKIVKYVSFLFLYLFIKYHIEMKLMGIEIEVIYQINAKHQTKTMPVTFRI